MPKTIQLHIYIEEKLYQKLWAITKRRFTPPAKKLSTVIREALQEYVEKHP